MSSTSMATILFNKSLTTMVKGIRAHKDRGESEYIQTCLAEIKNELKSTFPDVKAMALRKLIYLQMIGYDMSWASFHVVEVMSSPWFGHKRIGYLAAALCFTKDTDVILLTTHLFRKGFTQNVSGDTAITEGLRYETGAALSCLANICTPDLSQDLLSDIYGMMNSSQPYLRKKATLCLLKVFQQWPKALRLSFDRLKEKLKDENQGVVSAAVYVICELAAKNPKNYLALAPQFFQILTTSSNNWVLIKVVKLLGSLVPLEPRLAKKLQDPLCDIINTTPAKSLLYECVNTLLSGELKSKQVIRLCLDKLKSFIEDADQNLKYLGLLGLHKLMKAHPVVVAEHKDLILDCLRDDDVTIRHRALDLVTSMVSKRNIASIIRRLIEHLETSDGSYREHVLERIIFICSQENFGFIHDFEWYITILVHLTELSGVSRANALRITKQLMEVVVRVPDVRPFGVKAASDVLLANRLLSDRANLQTNAMTEVLYACGWIVGEFSEFVTEHSSLIAVLLKSQVTSLPVHVQNVFVQAAMKLFASALSQPISSSPHASASPTPSPSAATSATPTPAPAASVNLLNFDPLSPAKSPDVKEDAKQSAPPTETKQTTDETKDKPVAGVSAKARTFAEWSLFVDQISDVLLKQLPVFTHSTYVEVQERAASLLFVCKWLLGVEQPTAPAAGADQKQADTKSDTKSGETKEQNDIRKQRLMGLVSSFGSLFSEPLNPVSKKAQGAVEVPEGLDLDKPINTAPDSDDEDKDDKSDDDDDYSLSKQDDEPVYDKKKLTPEEIEAGKKRLEAEAQRRMNDPFYIKDVKKASSSSPLVGGGSDIDVNRIPVRDAGGLDLPPVKVSKKKGKKGKKDEEEEVKPTKTYKVLGVEELPKHAKTGSKAKKAKAKAAAADSDDENDLSAVDLNAPLRSDEVMPRVISYAEKQAQIEAQEAKKERSEKKKKKTKEDGAKPKKSKSEKPEKKTKKSASVSASAPAPAPAAAAAPVAASKPASTLDLFDPLGNRPTATPTPSPAPLAPVVATPASTSAESVKKKKTKKPREGKEKKEKKSKKEASK